MFRDFNVYRHHTNFLKLLTNSVLFLFLSLYVFEGTSLNSAVQSMLISSGIQEESKEKNVNNEDSGKQFEVGNIGVLRQGKKHNYFQVIFIIQISNSSKQMFKGHSYIV